MYTKFYKCTQCGADTGLKFSDSVLLTCRQCGHVIFDSSGLQKKQLPPDDWSFIQIGTTGSDIKKNFEVIGRVRLQLRNEYKNYWSLLYSDNTIGFLYESFGSFMILEAEPREYTDNVQKLRAGAKFKRKEGDVSLTGEFVEKCESVSYEGEVVKWKNFAPGFFVVQAGSDRGNGAVFHIINKDDVYYMLGKRITADDLKLQNIIQWNEWK